MTGKYFNSSKEGVYNSSGQSKLQPLPKDCREIELRSCVMVHACNSSTWEEECCGGTIELKTKPKYMRPCVQNISQT